MNINKDNAKSALCNKKAPERASLAGARANLFRLFYRKI